MFHHHLHCLTWISFYLFYQFVHFGLAKHARGCNDAEVDKQRGEMHELDMIMDMDMVKMDGLEEQPRDMVGGQEECVRVKGLIPDFMHARGASAKVDWKNEHAGVNMVKVDSLEEQPIGRLY